MRLFFRSMFQLIELALDGSRAVRRWTKSSGA